ncbi:MAG TPA: uracil-DNA glycosylase [Vicinamibacteria bacterium]|nr:uracil-DNA glycosylase [Vicinamibacteria bacterium]
MQFDLFDPGSNTILGATSYEELKKRLETSDCTKCALHRGRSTIVVDRGNPRAYIMTIGEGPGEQEDRQGLAFVGRAGQLFDKIMSAVGIDTNRDMLIANVVKCRPPENRSPKQEEAAECIPYLKRQIELVKPKVILLLGATALKHVDKSKSTFQMGDEAGKFFTLYDYPGIQFMVLYHPAALLYNAKLKPAMWSHVKHLRRYLEQNGLFRTARKSAS